MIDLLQPGLKVVFCGTAKGRVSARMGSFYAHPSNRFYRTLFETGLTPVQVAPENFSTLLDFGIGLTDLNQCESGMDRDLSRERFDIEGFRAKMLRYRPRLIAFTSLMAARTYLGDRKAAPGLQPEALQGIPLVALPSTSRANGHWTRDRHHWYQLAEMV